MKCPVCQNEDLRMTDRAGVEIDYCPRCRGIWLDRGELDKILERAGREEAQLLDRSRDRDHDDDYYKKQQPYYHKKKSWWHEIFD